MNTLRQAFREAVGEKVEKHDDLISRELPPDIDHADIRWDLIDISATTAQAYNTAIDHILSKEDQIVEEFVGVVRQWATEMREKIDNHEYCKNEGERWENGYVCAMYDLLIYLDELKGNSK